MTGETGPTTFAEMGIVTDLRIAGRTAELEPVPALLTIRSIGRIIPAAIDAGHAGSLFPRFVEQCLKGLNGSQFRNVLQGLVFGPVANAQVCS